MKTILVVDDEYAVAETLQEFLEDEGYRVIVAANGLEALEQISQHSPDLVLMDVMMPVLDGLEALRKLRENKQVDGMPVILMCAAPRSALAPGFDAQASAFLKKPFKLEALLTAIRSLIAA